MNTPTQNPNPRWTRESAQRTRTGIPRPNRSRDLPTNPRADFNPRDFCSSGPDLRDSDRRGPSRHDFRHDFRRDVDDPRSSSRGFGPRNSGRRSSSRRDSDPRESNHRNFDRRAHRDERRAGSCDQHRSAYRDDRRAHRDERRAESRDQRRSHRDERRAQFPDKGRATHRHDRTESRAELHDQRRATHREDRRTEFREQRTALRATQAALAGADRALRNLTTAYAAAATTPNPTHRDQARAILAAAHRDLHTILTPAP